MDDFTLYSVGHMLGSSKRRSHRDKTLHIFDIYIHFLQDNNLTTHAILPSGALPGPETVVRRSDVTDEGFEFLRRAEPKWFRALSRGTPPTNIGILQRELAKLRGELGKTRRN